MLAAGGVRTCLQKISLVINALPKMRFSILFLTLGIVWVDVDLPEVNTSWGSEGVMLELSTGKPLWSQHQSTK